MAERLTNRTHDGHAYLVNVKDDEHEVECKSEAPAVCIIKHANPCGFAIGGDLLDSYIKALLS